MDDLTALNLSKQARTAAYAGDHDEAIRLFQQALEIQPDDKTSLKGLAALTEDPAEKRRLLEHVLEIDPYDDEARAALERLDGDNDYVANNIDVTDGVLYCANHPDRETMLRCNKCNKPICAECAVQTPVGYRCKECVRSQQDKFYTASVSDRTKGFIAAAVGGVILGIAAALVGLLGLFFGILAAVFVGPAVGGGIGEFIWRATGRKRSRNFNVYATAIALVIAVPIALLAGRNILVALVVVGVAASAMYARLRFAS